MNSEQKNNRYTLSKDYKYLFQMICDGLIAVAFVDYNFRNNDLVMRDICKIERIAPYTIQIGVRGMAYGGFCQFDSAYGSEKELFIKDCERMNLEWIVPFRAHE